MDLDLKDKVVIVTGGSVGIGKAIADNFIQEGAKVVILDKQPPQTELPLYIKTELSKESECREAVRQTMALYGRLDILVNNAGNNDGVGLTSSVDEFRQSLETNLVHYFTMAHLLREQLVQNSGCIANIGSRVACRGQGGTSGYAAAKGGIESLTREWAKELAMHGVRVNAVIPSSVYTPLYEEWLKTFEDPAATLNCIAGKIPLENRLTRPEEIAAEVVFLCSKRASHTTGQLRYVDGGVTHLDHMV